MIPAFIIGLGLGYQEGLRRGRRLKRMDRMAAWARGYTIGAQDTRLGFPH